MTATRSGNTSLRASVRAALRTALSLGSCAVLLGATAGCVIDEVGEDDVGDGEVCGAARYWQHDWTARERDLVEAINDARAAGAMCGDAVRGPVPDLELSPALRCAARLHAADQAEAGSLRHKDTRGRETLERVDDAEYEGVPSHELLAGDFTDAQAVVDAWLDSESECRALLGTRVADVGPGFAQGQDGGTTAWVLMLGERRDTE